MVDVDEVSTDPALWSGNWPHQFDTYRRTADNEETEFGGSSALPQSKLDKYPWLKRLYAGYAFSLDYREARGHAYMLVDQEVTERVTKRPQSGACLHCHASIVPTYRRLGLIALDQPINPTSLAEDFNWPAVLEGFKVASTMTYTEAHDELLKTPDGSSNDNHSQFPAGAGTAHPVSCIDCHDPKSMQLRITRPGFVNGIQALAESQDPVLHLPSIQQWREQKGKIGPYDANAHATRQEMRTFVCAQCHVEYYCADKETLFFPWSKGLKVEQIEATYDKHRFPDGEKFFDYKHGETGAKVYKAQHPEFELYSQGIHARSGVSCADCHMPYERKGAMKVSSHWVRSPLLSINSSCQTCHHVKESELKARVETIQERTTAQIERAAVAMTEMLDAVREAQSYGVDKKATAKLFELQKKAMWRLDFVSSENSKGFHADQEAIRILAESIDYSRQAQALALRLRAKEVPTVTDKNVVPIKGVTPKSKP